MEHKRPGRRAYLLITLFAFLLVLFPFLFWYATWFGRKLADREIDEYLANAAAYADRFKLSPGQRQALIALDMTAIVAMGTHPLVPFLANLQVHRQRRPDR